MRATYALLRYNQGILALYLLPVENRLKHYLLYPQYIEEPAEVSPGICLRAIQYSPLSFSIVFRTVRKVRSVLAVF